MPDGRVFPLAVYLPFGGVRDFLHHPVSRSTSVTDVENRLQHGRYAPTTPPHPPVTFHPLSLRGGQWGAACVSRGLEVVCDSELALSGYQ